MREFNVVKNSSSYVFSNLQKTFKMSLKLEYKIRNTLNKHGLCLPSFIFTLMENFGNCYAGSAPPPPYTHTSDQQ